MQKHSSLLRILPDDVPVSPLEHVALTRPVLHAFEANGKRLVLNPISGAILEIDDPQLFSLIGLPPETTPEDLSNLEAFASSDLDQRTAALEMYRDLLTEDLVTELAPVLPNDFDDPSFFSQFKSSIDHFSLIPTHQCNLRCSYCVYTGSYEGQREHEKVDMPDSVVDQAAEFIAGLGDAAPKIDMRIYGGESLINWPVVKRFHQRLRALAPKEKPLFFKVTTNGLILSEEISDYCIENNLLVQVSLDGPEAVHDRYRISAGGQPTFKRIFANLQRIYTQAPDFFRRNVTISCVYGPPYDVEEADAWFREQEMFATHGFRERNFQAGHIDTVNTSFFDGLDYKERWARTLDRLRERYLAALESRDYRSVRFFPACLFERQLLQVGPRLAFDRANPSHEARWARYDCIPGEQLAINPRGEVFICIQTTNYVSIGNVWDGLNEAAIKDSRRLFLERKNGGCRGCWAYKFCDMCIAKMHRGKVLHNMTFNENCEATRKKIDSAVRLYCEALERAPGALPALFAQGRGMTFE